MKRFLITVTFILTTVFALSQEKGLELSAGATYMTESGNLYFAEVDTYYFVGDATLIKLDATYFFSVFGAGLYANLGSPWYDGYEETAMIEIGPTFKYKIPLGDFMATPSLYLGYRKYAGTAGDGMGVNFSLLAQYPMDSIIPYLDIGFLSQPAGGNDATDITYGPVFNIGAGVSVSL